MLVKGWRLYSFSSNSLSSFSLVAVRCALHLSSSCTALSMLLISLSSELTLSFCSFSIIASTSDSATSYENWSVLMALVFWFFVFIVGVFEVWVE